jgi:hypothetical protein
MRTAKDQQGEFAMLIDDFESITGPTPESQQFADLLDRFQIAAAHLLAPGNDLVPEDARDLVDRFQRLWQPYLEARAAAPPSMNIWKAVGIGLDEVEHCRVLTWLLDPNGAHCQGTRLLRCLFEAMGEPWIDEADTISVRREVSTPDGDSRIDIVIKSRSVFVCIEAKIQAEESSEQLVRYFERVGKKTDRRFVGRLLTVEGKRREPVAGGFTRLLWSDVAGALRRFAGKDHVSDPFTARSPFVQELASQYADFITSHFRYGSTRE